MSDPIRCFAVLPWLMAAACADPMLGDWHVDTITEDDVVLRVPYSITENDAGISYISIHDWWMSFREHGATLRSTVTAASMRGDELLEESSYSEAHELSIEPMYRGTWKIDGTFLEQPLTLTCTAAVRFARCEGTLDSRPVVWELSRLEEP